YLSGRHNAKIGFDGGYYTRKQTNNPNNLRFGYSYRAPAETCVQSPTPPPSPAIWCGNTPVVNGVSQSPAELLNPRRRPIPENVTFNTGVVTFDEWVNYSALYAQ